MQKLQDMVLAEVQGWIGAGDARAVQVMQGRCRGGAGLGDVGVVQAIPSLHCLHPTKHNIRCMQGGARGEGTPQLSTLGAHTSRLPTGHDSLS